MQDRAGGVDDANMAGLAIAQNLLLDPLEDRVFAQVGGAAAVLSDHSAQLVEGGAAMTGDVVSMVAHEERLGARMLEQLIDGRELAQEMGSLISHKKSKICTVRGVNST